MCNFFYDFGCFFYKAGVRSGSVSLKWTRISKLKRILITIITMIFFRSCLYINKFTDWSRQRELQKRIWTLIHPLLGWGQKPIVPAAWIAYCVWWPAPWMEAWRWETSLSSEKPEIKTIETREKLWKHHLVGNHHVEQFIKNQFWLVIANTFFRNKIIIYYYLVIFV